MLLAHDIPVAFASRAVPTQMSSYEVVERGAAAGVVITASHNPWTDNGFKVKSPTGSAAGPDVLSVIEAQIAANGGRAIERRPFADADEAGLIERFDPYDGYERFVRRTVDLDALKAADISILVEPMYGAGAGWIPSSSRAGGSASVRSTRSAIRSSAGSTRSRSGRGSTRRSGSSPTTASTWGCCSTVTPTGPARPTSRARSSTSSRSPVCSCTTWPNTAAGATRSWSPSTTRPRPRGSARTYGIATHETSVGFKYIGPKMIETGAMMGAEESGGYGFGMHLPERDGIYADLLLLDLFLREKAAGRWPVSKAIEHFHEIAGPSFYRRIDVHVTAGRVRRGQAAAAGRPAANAPTELAGQPVTRTQALDTNDGFKFFVADGSWLLVRTSGTEPLVRVYTEATSEDIREAMLEAGERLVRGS